MTMTATALPQFEDHGRHYNGSQTQRRRIGTYHHRDASRVFQQSQEVAAWHRHGTFPVGDYPIYEYRHGGYYNALVCLTGGVITSASFPSLFGGVAYGTDRGPEEIGLPFEHSWEIASFGIAELRDDDRFDWHEGIEIRNLGNYSDGRPMLQAYDPVGERCIGRW